MCWHAKVFTLPSASAWYRDVTTNSASVLSSLLEILQHRARPATAGSVTADVLITTTSVGMHLAVGKTLLAASAVGNFSVAFDHECTSLDTQLLKNTAEQQRPSRRQNIPRSSRRQLRRVRAVQTAERPATEAPSKSSEGSAERRMLHGGHGISVVSPPITDMQLPMLCDSPTDAFDLAVAGDRRDSEWLKRCV